MTIKIALALMAISLATTGCGGDGRVDVNPVAGKVTVKGQPAVGAQLIFYAQDEALKEPGIPVPEGTVGEDGSFRLTTYEEGDGAPAGQYKVSVIWEQVLKESNDPESRVARDRLDGRYAHPDQSGLTATIAEGDNQLPPFELP
jgi:hypothetical protein